MLEYRWSLAVFRRNFAGKRDIFAEDWLILAFELGRRGTILLTNLGYSEISDVIFMLVKNRTLSLPQQAKSNLKI